MRSGPQIKINAFTSARLVALMLPGDLTLQELCDETGLHRITVERYCRELRRAGAAYICRWDPDVNGRHNLKIHKIGKGKDAKRPPPLTDAQRRQRARDKRKAQQMLAVTAGRGQFVKSGNGQLRFEEIAPCA